VKKSSLEVAVAVGAVVAAAEREMLVTPSQTM
jgi:hypothetical protein